jgi:2-keto-4-pentenoate hydratase/2-oxohepta-3-ene-1,7-dioic acid hydratase in catechol pathway
MDAGEENDMKLATFSDGKGVRIGVAKGDGIVDLSAAAPGLPTTLKGLLAAGDGALAEAQAAAQKADDVIPLSAITLKAPIPDPGKVLAIGLNYGDHIAETGMTAPEHQVWFNKQRNCINDPYGDVNDPVVSDMLDYEAEMCFVIGKRCKHVPRERAHEVIAGFCCGNDVTVRDWQLRSPTMQIGKSFDTHGPLGPWLVTPDEVGDPHDLNVKCWVNGEERQSSNTKHLIFDCYDQIAHLSQSFTLDVGDVIFSGTPAGVGIAMKPAQYMKAGDVVRVEIEKLGALENKIVPEDGKTIIEG